MSPHRELYTLKLTHDAISTNQSLGFSKLEITVIVMFSSEMLTIISAQNYDTIIQPSGFRELLKYENNIILHTAYKLYYTQLHISCTIYI